MSDPPEPPLDPPLMLRQVQWQLSCQRLYAIMLHLI